jgi:outer membrane protein assembly factor BamB
MTKARLLSLGLAAVLGLVFTGCQQHTSAEPPVLKATTTDELAKRTALYGNDTRAWLTNRGGNGDAGFCAARLKLPLATEPVWEYAYTSAEFSSHWVSSIVHYDGTLYLAADSTQLVGIAASNGSVEFNSDVYAHKDADLNEELKRLYAHPQGLLLGQDNLGRFYAWDLLAPGLPRLWLGQEILMDAGFVTDADLMLTSWGDQLYCIDTFTGSMSWQVPSVSQPGGVVLSQSGIGLWWSSEGRLQALDARDGKPRWSIITTDLIERAVIDDQRELAYVVYGGEYIECRRLGDGEILWSYSWKGLYSAEERQQFYEEVIRRQAIDPSRMVWKGANNRIIELALVNDSVLLGLSSGHVLALDQDGGELWKYQGQAPISDLLAFENAVLIGALYVRPEANPSEISAFSLNEPDWPQLKIIRLEQAQQAAKLADTEEEEGPALQPPPDPNAPETPGVKEAFYRFAALDLTTGLELSAFEPDRGPGSTLTPANTVVVFAEAPRGQRYAGTNMRDKKQRVLAYSWIELEGD